MTEAVFYVLLFGLPVLGAVVRRWWLVPGAALAWLVFYVGLFRGLWGYGTGEHFLEVAVLVALVGTTTTAVAVLVGRLLLGR